MCRLHNLPVPFSNFELSCNLGVPELKELPGRQKRFPPAIEIFCYLIVAFTTTRMLPSRCECFVLSVPLRKYYGILQHGFITSN